MKKRNTYLALLITLVVLLFISIYLSNKKGARHVELGAFFFEKVSDLPPVDNDSLVEMQLIDRYLNDSITPFSDSKTPLRFLKKIRKRNAENLIRNGNLDQAEEISSQYQSLLKRFMHLSDSLDLPMDISRKEFFKRWNSVAKNQKGKGRVWTFFFQRRLSLGRAFKMYKKQLELILSTERVIREQKEHLPELYCYMNSLQNLDGTDLPVYVISYPKVFSGRGRSVAGMALFATYKGLFTSASPNFVQSYPGLIQKKNALSIHLKKGVSGSILSHELGHLYYLYHNWDEYLHYRESRHRDYRKGGHGLTDPSGQAAEMAEKGIMPDR
ncbi:MAG: hypothetical protein R8P61_34125 [Bacteroidia bacterium]|nr:hypothetical protein [Bacteroidia bacterium]